MSQGRLILPLTFLTMKFTLLDSIQNKFLMESEIRNILNTYFRDVYETNDYFNFRCNYCGDSQKSKYKKRGYIIKDASGWYYKCHNCGKSAGIMWWMKTNFPVNFKHFISGCLKNKREDEQSQKTEIPVYKNIMTQKKTAHDESSIIKTFKNIMKFDIAVEYCEKRKIPKEVYSKWFYCESGKFRGRLIIPFYNDKNKIHYYQGRAILPGIEPRYDSRKGSNLNSIYNYYLVDCDEWVTVLEGPIDATFVDNSVALTGVHKSFDDELMNRFTKKRYLLDNDKDGRAKSLTLIMNGEKVFNWKKFLKDYECDSVKDVNEFILKNPKGITKLTMDIMNPYFTNSYFDKAYFL